MSIFTKEYWTKESIDKRKKANKEKTKKYHEKLYPKKNNDAIKVNKLKNSGAMYVQSVGGGKDFKDVKVIGEKEGVLQEKTYLRKIYGDQKFSAIQRTTAAGICSCLDMYFNGKINSSGFVKQETINWESFTANKYGEVYL